MDQGNCGDNEDRIWTRDMCGDSGDRIWTRDMCEDNEDRICRVLAKAR